MGAHDHKEGAKGETARVAVLTVSDTRTPETNVSGKLAAELLRAAGHEVRVERIVPNTMSAVGAAIREAFDVADLVLTLGGTGISRRDVSVDAALTFVEKELPGFGELFRSMSAAEIGTATILSRALLGLTEGRKLIGCLPGSEGAVRLALEKILVPELPHLVRELRK
jgi:molybdenum cofactor biosynthesis protein B